VPLPSFRSREFLAEHFDVDQDDDWGAPLQHCTNPGCPCDPSRPSLFALACEFDLEGIVAKHRDGAYISNSEETSWLKIRNRTYSQMQGRNELFERSGGRWETGETDGWAGCVLACVGAGM